MPESRLKSFNDLELRVAGALTQRVSGFRFSAEIGTRRVPREVDPRQQHPARWRKSLQRPGVDPDRRYGSSARAGFALGYRYSMRYLFR